MNLKFKINFWWHYSVMAMTRNLDFYCTVLLFHVFEKALEPFEHSSTFNKLFDEEKSHSSFDTMRNVCLTCFWIFKMIDLNSHWNSNLSIFSTELVSVQNKSHGRWRRWYAETRREYNTYVLVATISLQFGIIISRKGIYIHKCMDAKWSTKKKSNVYYLSYVYWNGTYLIVGFMRREAESESTNEWLKSLLSAVKWHFYWIWEGLWNDLSLDLFMEKLLNFDMLKLKRINE